MFTKNSKIKEILKEPELKGKEYMINIAGGIPSAMFANLPLTRLQKMCGWDAISMAEGLQYVSEKMKQKQIFYDFWSVEEKRRDPSRENTGLAAFTTGKKGKYAVICAGGSYQVVCSVVEAYPLAKRLNEAGYSAFVVKYRTGKDGLMPNPIDDLAQAVRFITDHAEEFQVEPEDYAVIGSSAGGHLAAMFGTKSKGYSVYGLKRPGSIFLAYPVISYVESADHSTIRGMRKISLGKRKMDDLVMKEMYSVERQVTDSYPPTFLWQCEEDSMCPVINSQVMAQALKRHRVPYIYEIYPGTAHGWGIADRTPAEGWLERAVTFWQENI